MFGGFAATVALIVGGIGLTSVTEVLPAAGATPPRTTCSAPYPGVISGGMYASLRMPAGSSCVTEGDVVVNRGITLGAGSGLGVQSGSLTVNGSVVVGPYAAFADVTPSAPAPITVNGALIVESHGWVSTYGPTIAGPVWATNPSAVQIFDTQISGPVVINGGGGRNPVLAAQGACYTDCVPPVYNYNLNWLGWDQIRGPVSETNYAGVWAGIIGNVMGPMIFADNSNINGSAIGFNTIYGPARCSDNLPGAPNTGPDVSGPSVVHGPVWGDQRSTCTGVVGGTWPEG